MQPTLDVRRHADGTLDFDFYRRRAARRRRLTRRLLFKARLARALRLAAHIQRMLFSHPALPADAAAVATK